MSNIAQLKATSVYSDRQLELVRRTVAKDCNDDEFNTFVQYCVMLRLDPIRRQIYAFVYNKDKPDKRQLTIVTSIAGFRTIAARAGDYRPDGEGPVYVFDETAKSHLNPTGLVSATVKVWKHAKGEWFPIAETAHWDEFAPIKDEWDYNRQTNKREPTGRQTLDTSGQWGKMPRLMLAKCAEALAFRKGWSDDLSNVYAEEETDRQKVLDLTATEVMAENREQRLLEKFGAHNAITFTFDDLGTLEPVSFGKVHDRVSAHLRELEGQPSAIAIWKQRNRIALREFWARDKPAALDLQKQIEKAETFAQSEAEADVEA